MNMNGIENLHIYILRTGRRECSEHVIEYEASEGIGQWADGPEKSSLMRQM